MYGARHDIEPYHPVAVLGRRKDIFGRFRGPDWTDWLKIIRGETTQDRHDQLMTRTNLSAGILRRDPRAVLGMAAPPVRSLADDKSAGMPKRVCPVCGSIYEFKTGRDSPCEHVKRDGTVVP